MKSMTMGLLILATAGAAGCGPVVSPPSEQEKTARKVRGLVLKLVDPKAAVRAQAADELVEIGKPAVKPLIEALQGKTGKATTGSVGLMGATKGASAVMLRGDDALPAQAARILGRIGDERAVDPLIEALVNEAARASAAKALTQITGQDFGADAKAWKRWRDGEGGS